MDIPIIAITSKSVKETEQWVDLLELDGYIPKPVHREKLLSLIDSIYSNGGK